MFPFYLPENIGKNLASWWFQGKRLDKKKNFAWNGLCFNTFFWVHTYADVQRQNILD